MSKQREYPFTAYVLTPSMGIKKVELVRQGWMIIGNHKTASGSVYGDSHLHETPQAAIAAGRAKLDEQRAKLAIQLANIKKRAENLDKAEGKL